MRMLWARARAGASTVAIRVLLLLRRNQSRAVVPEGRLRPQGMIMCEHDM